jgi:hypothetical protein
VHVEERQEINKLGDPGFDGRNAIKWSLSEESEERQTALTFRHHAANIQGWRAATI